jgi:hypothetical protein
VKTGRIGSIGFTEAIMAAAKLAAGECARPQKSGGEVMNKSTMLLFGAALPALALGSSASRADLILSLSQGNSAISGFTGPYGSVDVSLIDSTHATVTFTAGSAGGNTYLFGDGGSVDLNVNGTYGLVGTPTGTNLPSAGFSTPTYVSNTPGQVDGWGKFDLSLNFFDGFADAANSITFEIQDLSGTWASAAAVLTNNANGAEAAAHTFVCANPCTEAEGAAATGFSANGGTNIPVPEPSSLAILGVSLVGLVGFIRKASRFTDIMRC